MPLSIDMLTAHGFSPRTVGVWRKHLGAELLPLQEKALREFGFLHGRDLVVFAPTASGKTFVAEMAALRHLEQGRAVAYLVPTRALAEEKAREFGERYRELRLRIVCSTRERPENDSLIDQGRFDLLVAVYEKFGAHLVTRPALLARLGLIVADELQLLGDRERGPALDVLLTKVRLAPHRVQRIALSAVLRDALRIANWLEADLLPYDKRPVDLLEGVVDVETGRFHWRSFNTGARGCDPLTEVFAGNDRKIASPALSDSPQEFRRDSVVALARWIAEERGEQALVFVPTRWMSRAWAEEMAFASRLDPAGDALECLDRHEPNRGRDLLATCLRAGIAFHNADLPAALRRLIERHFQSGEIRALFSTPTLAQGMNLAGRNVIQVPHMVGEDPGTGQASVVHLSRERFRNQGGRAARTGRAEHAGRSMVLGAGEAEVERLLRLLLDGELEEIAPPLDGADLAPALLDLLVSGAARSLNDLVGFLLETYTGQTVWSADPPGVRRRVLEALRRLESARLVGIHEDGGRIETGGLAQAVAAAGIIPETAQLLIEWLDCRGDPAGSGTGIEPLVAAALAREIRPVLPPLVGDEYHQPTIFEELHSRLSLDRGAGGRHLWERLARPTGFTVEDRRAAKLALLLHDWIGPEDTETLERRYGMLSGSIASAGAQAAWILRAGSGLASALGLAEAPEMLRRLADRLEPGVGEEGLELARLRVEGLGRGAIASLVREGVRTAADVRAWPEDRLRAILPEELCAALLEAAGETGHVAAPDESKESDPHATRAHDTSRNNSRDRGATLPMASVSAPPTTTDRVSEVEAGASPSSSPDLSSIGEKRRPGAPLLMIDSQSPGMVEWGGRRVRLPGLPFRLLLALAAKPGRGVTYRELMDRVWRGEAVVEQQQINYHRSRVTKALTAVMGTMRARALITTNSGQGMVLNLQPEEVRIL